MKVYIVNGYGMFDKFFADNGVEVVKELEKASFVQFTGGSDVSPSFYNHPQHHTTRPFEDRDTYEKEIFEKCLKLGIPMAGICRGAQFLNVMSGGVLYQDVDEHTSPHVIYDDETGEEFLVTSTHHQMMFPSDDAIIIAQAFNGSNKTYWNGEEFVTTTRGGEPEVVFYPKTRCLCFQPHPEYKSMLHGNSGDRMVEYYFEKLEDYLFN